MSPRRRAVALGGLALVLGALAAADVGGREAALRSSVGPAVPVVVARTTLDAGHTLATKDLAVRQVPRRWAPVGAYARARSIVGLRTAVAVAAGTDLAIGMVDDGTGAAAGAPVRPGERVADLVAVGSPTLVVAGARVDVLVTRSGDDGSGRTEVALEDVEVLVSRRAPAGASDDGVARVAVSLRVTLRQAVYLAAAQSFAHEIRLLPRAAGDRAHASRLSVGSDL